MTKNASLRSICRVALRACSTHSLLTHGTLLLLVADNVRLRSQLAGGPCSAEWQVPLAHAFLDFQVHRSFQRLAPPPRHASCNSSLRA